MNKKYKMNKTNKIDKMAKMCYNPVGEIKTTSNDKESDTSEVDNNSNGRKGNDSQFRLFRQQG